MFKSSPLLLFIILVYDLGVLINNNGVSANLNVDGSVMCGDRKCSEYEYCSQYDKQCKSCRDICDKKVHNFDETLCENSCQGYLHDIRYVRNSDNNPGGYQALSSELQKWKTTTISTLTILILFIITYCICEIYKWKKSNNITLSSLRNKFITKKSNNKSTQNGTNESGVGVTTITTATNVRPELRIEIPPSITQSDSPSTMTTGISRLPAEDSALDYAYDNPAMTSNASSPNVKPHESSF